MRILSRAIDILLLPAVLLCLLFMVLALSIPAWVGTLLDRSDDGPWSPPPPI